jgi:hypothetical protein
MANRYYRVARVAGAVALLLDDEQLQIAVPLVRLPRRTAGGVLLSVPLNAAGTPSWSDAEIDEEEAKRRVSEQAETDHETATDG